MQELSTEQKLVLGKVVDEGKNVFFTGCGGVGKTYLVNRVIEELRSKLGNEGQVAVTASTGRAAFGIGGSTLHSFAGIGLGRGTAESLVRTIKGPSLTRWKSVKVLIIDEISMIDGDLFDKLEFISRKIRKTSKCFGGIQLVLSGDFLQLPPVSNNEEIAKRAFESSSWSKCISEYICLRSMFRQSEPDFINALAEVRIGHIGDDTRKILESLRRELNFDEDSKPVNLYSTKAEADEYNSRCLEEIDEEILVYSAVDKGNNSLLKQCPAAQILELKKGSQVMLVKNMNDRLVNGTVGIIVGFTNKVERLLDGSENTMFKEQIPIVRFSLLDGSMVTRPIERVVWETRMSDNTISSSRCQIPLILAWAITIHKSQGQTIQRLNVNLERVFETGQIYVALSRAVSVNGIQVTGLDIDKVISDRKSLEFYIENDLI